MGATETISKWIVETTYEDIPPEAIRVANESCFDLLGVILAGSMQPVGEIIKQSIWKWFQWLPYQTSIIN